MGEVTASRWDTPTGRAAWALLVAFTALSSYLNYRSANLDGSHEIAHAAVPFVVLVVGGFVELALLSTIHRAAKAATVTALFACFAVVLVTSYLGILPIAKSWFHAMPERVVFGLAAIPDVVMLAAVSVLMSLRARRKGTVSETAQPSRWAKIGGNLMTRAEQMTEPKPVIDTTMTLPMTPERQVTDTPPSTSHRQSIDSPSTPAVVAEPVDDTAVADAIDADSLAFAATVRARAKVKSAPEVVHRAIEALRASEGNLSAAASAAGMKSRDPARRIKSALAEMEAEEPARTLTAVG